MKTTYIVAGDKPLMRQVRKQFSKLKRKHARDGRKYAIVVYPGITINIWVNVFCGEPMYTHQLVCTAYEGRDFDVWEANIGYAVSVYRNVLDLMNKTILRLEEQD